MTGMACGRPGSASSRGGIAAFFFQAPSMASSCRETQRTRSAVRPQKELVARHGKLGAEVKRKEGPRLIAGASAYVGDITLPGLHHVAFVRSPHAHARIRRIDTTAALRRPGVRAVFTGRDIDGRCAPLPLAGAGEGGEAAAAPKRTHLALSLDRVRYVGEAVAAVVAESESLARDAVDDVVVEWEPLAAVSSQLAAMADGAPRIHDDAAPDVEHEKPITAREPHPAFAP